MPCLSICLVPLLLGIGLVEPPPFTGGPLDEGLDAGRIFLDDAVSIATSPARTTRRQATVWGGILALTALVYSDDRAILNTVRRTRHDPALRWFHELGHTVEPVGHMGGMNKYYFGGLAVSYVAGQDRAARVFAEILESHFIAGLGKNAIQLFAGRTRPFEDQGARSWGRDGATSFPSGHALNIFQLATVLSHHADRRWFTIGAYTVAAAVGVQRVESRSHWPSDVILSAAIGTAVARCVVKRHERFGAAAQPVARVGPDGPMMGLRWSF